MRSRYKKWAVDYLAEHQEKILDKDNIDELFLSKRDILLEIGAGKGDFIIGLSKLNNDKILIANERVNSISGVLLKRIVTSDIQNIFLFPHDIEMLFPLLKDSSIAEIYLNFSDPWPKKRHEKRRLTHLNKLKEYYRILKDDGRLVFKTDNETLFIFSLKELMNTSFGLINSSTNYINKNEEPMSEYEKKFRRNNKAIFRIEARK